MNSSFLADPYPAFAALRLHEPVCWDASTNSWFVTRYGNVRDLLMDPRLASPCVDAELAALPSAERELVAAVCEFFGMWMVFADAPRQRKVRRVIGRAFTPPALAVLRADIAQTAAAAVAGYATSGGDLVPGLIQVYAALTASRLLGVTREELPTVAGWSQELMAFLNRSELDLDQVRSTLRVISDITDYVMGSILPRGEGPVASVLRSGLDHGEIDAQTAAATFAHLLTGGLEPLSSALGVMLVGLQRHPDQRQALREGLVPYSRAVEEALRYDSPFHLAPRQAAADIEIGEQIIRCGNRVNLVLASANRDDDEFTRAGEFDIRRTGPVRHLAFGRGSHYCLGAAVARQTMAALLLALDDQLPALRIDTEHVSRLPAFGATVLAKVPGFVS